jgi:high-affinity nickel-transport protein
MRHAFDADHISAIDNTTRRLMAEEGRPLSVGFFFSLGHSSVVFALTLLLSIGFRTLGAQTRDANSSLHSVASIVGTSVSGSFLYLIAGLNLAILISIVRALVDLRQGKYDELQLERRLEARGFMNRVFGQLSRRIDSPPKMYFIGILFGLGFDTATEVALLIMSGTAVASGLPIYSILSLPLLFAAGMTTFDTIDGCFMNVAYGWAFARPIRKVYYNFTITALSVAAALFIGSIEILGLLPAQLHWSGRVWSFFEHFDMNTAGFALVGLFIATWTVALGVWHFGRLEERWEIAALRARASREAVDDAAI